MNFTELFSGIGFVGALVLGCLLALSIYSVSVMIDRYRRFRAASRESQAFLPEFGRCLSEGKLNDAAASAQRHGQSHCARVVSAGIAELRMPAAEGLDQIEMVSRALDRTTTLTVVDMKKGLGGLATIGSTAPFIGLFGTVIGIIHAFEGIASTGSGGAASVSSGIAEALVATALGILVAIPAVMAFNYFVGALERFQLEMGATSEQLIDALRRSRAVHAAR